MPPLTEARTFDPTAIHRRTVVLHDLEIRAEGDQLGPMIRGHAAVFNQWASIVPGLLEERVAPGAFKKTLRNADVRALFNHNPDFVLGRNRAGTLGMHEDSKGLAVEITPPETQWARDLVVSMKRGDITQMSFGFKPVEGGWTEERGPEGNLRVTLREVTLFDVSVVTFPAYEKTDAWARSTINSLQRLLSEPGESSSDGAYQRAQERAERLASFKF